MSLGGDGRVQRGVQRRDRRRSTRAGAVVVVAAGNSSGHAVGTPANCPGVIAVAGSAPRRRQGRLLRPRPADHDQRAGRQLRQHQRAATPCLYPILTTTNTGTTTPVVGPPGAAYTDSFNASLGTSFSAPLVAGTVALMLSVQPDADAGAGQGDAAGDARGRSRPPAARAGIPVHVRRADRPSVDQLECYCTTSTCGAGMLDAHAARARRSSGVQAEHLADDDDADRRPGGHAASSSVVGAGQSIATYAWTILNAGTTGATITSATNADSVVVSPTAARRVRDPADARPTTPASSRRRPRR